MPTDVPTFLLIPSHKLKILNIFLPSPPVTEKGILTETSQRSQCTWLCQLFCRSFDSHQQQEQHVKTHTAIFSKARESLEKGVTHKALFTRAAIGNEKKKMEKRERVNKQNSFTQSKSNSRAGGKEPICTNAVTLMEEVTCIYSWMLVSQCWDFTQSYHTVFQQDLQYHVPGDQVLKYCLWKALLCSLSFWCISREWSDTLPCLPLNHPTLKGIIDFNLREIVVQIIDSLQI